MRKVSMFHVIALAALALAVVVVGALHQPSAQAQPFPLKPASISDFQQSALLTMGGVPNNPVIFDSCSTVLFSSSGSIQTILAAPTDTLQSYYVTQLYLSNGGAVGTFTLTDGSAGTLCNLIAPATASLIVDFKPPLKVTTGTAIKGMCNTGTVQVRATGFRG